MRIEKLNENKIRIFLNNQDLQENNIDLHDFMSNSVESQDLFLNMLNKAENEVGFKTNNYKLIIEALASSDGNFVLTVTRIKPEVNQLSRSSTVKPKVKRSVVQPNKLLSIYTFNTFDEFCEFCNYINSCQIFSNLEKLKSSSLVLYNKKYYLILSNLKMNILELKKLSCVLSEFSTKLRNENLLERKIKEYGKIIIPKNAIATCLKYF